MSLTNSPAGNLVSREVFRWESLGAPRSLLLALVLTLFVIVGDQFAAPILQTTSPLWATATCLLMIWRRGKSSSIPSSTPIGLSISKERLAVFFAAHLALVLVARSTLSAFEPMAGTATIGGTLLAMSKLLVLAPTIVLFPVSHWKKLVSAYSSEGKAALFVLVLIANVAKRVLEALWPWYGQVLGRSVYILARLFVSGLGYQNDLNPMVTGPDMDVTIPPACSGITGFELFGDLFALVVLLDWNRLRKSHSLLVYVVGLFVMLLGNALRITSFIVLGNKGFIDFASRFHLSAGWIFFSVTFLVYLSLTYGWMLKNGTVPKIGRGN